MRDYAHDRYADDHRSAPVEGADSRGSSGHVDCTLEGNACTELICGDLRRLSARTVARWGARTRSFPPRENFSTSVVWVVVKACAVAVKARALQRSRERTGDRYER